MKSGTSTGREKLGNPTLQAVDKALDRSNATHPPAARIAAAKMMVPIESALTQVMFATMHGSLDGRYWVGSGHQLNMWLS
ncbi:hypothetical protein [Sphingomonas sp. OTU376]|uniref:hypothetical protein n=1 Tax=Sphingomonas sp. OTU376 TaxID=3043863 RepID=UPI00313A992E